MRKLRVLYENDEFNEYMSPFRLRLDFVAVGAAGTVGTAKSHSADFCMDLLLEWSLDSKSSVRLLDGSQCSLFVEKEEWASSPKRAPF